ncbi:hypothetical protein KW115_01195 [Methylococcus sp. Mc7]|nr:hypothetical protein KW115_01195 [Methylococcus sp. Mc7]
MVVPNVFNTHDGDLGPVDTAVWPDWAGIVCRGKYQPPAPGKFKRELAITVTFERVRIAGDQLSYPRGGFHLLKAQQQLTRTGRPELLLGDGLFLTQLADFLVPKLDIQIDPYPITIYQIGKL